MDFDLVIKISVLVVGFYMAWNIGANDVSNAMGTSVGSGALTLRRAVVLAAVLEFSGAFFLGGHVSETIQGGILNVAGCDFTPRTLVLGMVASLLSTGVWLHLASYVGWPVSTTHAIVGSLTGFGIVAHGLDGVIWSGVFRIASSWVISPCCAAIVAFGLFSFLQKRIFYAHDPVKASHKLVPLLAAVVVIMLGSSLFSLEAKWGGWLLISTGGIALLVAVFLHYFFQGHQFGDGAYRRPLGSDVVSLEKAARHLHRARLSSPEEFREEAVSILARVDQLIARVRRPFSGQKETLSAYQVVEKMFISVQILSACCVAFAHGANDVANAVGPLAAVMNILQTGNVVDVAKVSPLLLAFGGVGIVSGLATWGWRVIETVGKKITELTPTRGFCAEFSAALTILLASKLGLPISTTHCLVGAVIGIGLARGMSGINAKTIGDILLAWVFTTPVSAVLSATLFFILSRFL